MTQQESKEGLPGSTRRSMSSYLNWSPYYVIPSTVLVIHTLLLVFSWTFLAMTISGPVAFPPRDAINFQKHTEFATWVVTQIATVIALLSTISYTRAIRYALARRLATGVSLYTVVAGLKIAGPSLLTSTSSSHRLWLIGSLLCFLAVHFQTAGYTTLLTPKQIVVTSNMTGYELDLTSSEFRKLFATQSEQVAAKVYSRVLPVAESSGSTAVSARFLLPSILNYNHFTYSNSTRGILPVTVEEVHRNLTSEWGRMMPANVKVEHKWATPPGLPVSFSMSQQGFSANVTCRKIEDLDASTIPSLTLLTQQLNKTVLNMNINLAQLRTHCPDTPPDAPDGGFDYSDPVLTSATLDAFFGASCGVNDTSGRSYTNLILMGSGLYKEIKTTVCSIYPIVGTLTLNYTDNTQLFNSSFPNFINGTDSTGGVDAPWLAEFTINMFLRALTVGQSTNGSAMGNAILAFIADLPNDNDEILSQYVRGFLELSGTFIRTMYTQNGNDLYPGGSSIIPPSMLIATKGTYSATTIGFHRATAAAVCGLIAPTVISLISILLVGVTFATRNHEEEENRYFDPGDVLHLFSAASAGGMKTTFPRFDEIKEDSCDEAKIKVGRVNGVDSRIGFTAADE